MIAVIIAGIASWLGIVAYVVSCYRWDQRHNKR